MTKLNEFDKAEKMCLYALQRDYANKYKIVATPKGSRTDTGMTGFTDNRGYVVEIKGYFNPDYPRPTFKYPDFQIDYDKLRACKKIAMNKNEKPLLICYFSDKKVIWDLTKEPWEDTAKWVWVNKEGVDYGNSEWELQATLKFDNAKITDLKEEDKQAYAAYREKLYN